MDLRATPGRGIDFATGELARQTAELQRTQQQISTGLRLHRPSDDPAAIRRAIVQQDQLSRLDTHIESVQHVKSRVGQAHVQLREAQQLFVQARSVALSAPQAIEESEVDALAAELDGILSQLISIANASDETGYLFSGVATQTKPFEVDRVTGKVTYFGDDGGSSLHLTGDVARDALVSGEHIFAPAVREQSFVIGKTGIGPGTATDSSVGHRTVTVSHTQTTYFGTSGVAPGTSTLTSDTIVGAVGTHQLTISDTSGIGVAGIVSLNGGGELPFTNTDTDLLLRGPSGEEVSVDLSAITPGFNGTVDILAEGTLSIDGGQTTQPIAFLENDTIEDSSDGTAFHINTAGIQQIGIAEVEFSGSTNAFQVLIELRDDLLNTRGLLTQDRIDTFQRRISDVDRIEDHFLNEIGAQGVALQQFERLQVRTEDEQLEQRIRYGETTNADLAEAALRMQELLNLQQFTMAAVSRIQSQNLLQFLQ